MQPITLFNQPIDTTAAPLVPLKAMIDRFATLGVQVNQPTLFNLVRMTTPPQRITKSGVRLAMEPAFNQQQRLLGRPNFFGKAVSDPNTRVADVWQQAIDELPF